MKHDDVRRTVDAVPWDDVDLEMHELVKAIRASGLETIGCCFGHGRECGYVSFLVPDSWQRQVVRHIERIGDYFEINDGPCLVIGIETSSDSICMILNLQIGLNDIPPTIEDIDALTRAWLAIPDEQG